MQAILLGNSEEAYTKYKNDIIALDNKIGFKLGGFTQKDKFKLILIVELQQMKVIYLFLKKIIKYF